VIEPSFHKSETFIEWDIPESLPHVWADRQALLQAFLKIAKNSQRALEGQDQKKLIVRVSVDGNSVVIRFIDTGPGVPSPEDLFAPFQPGAQASGLGLYLSRTFVRAFRGEIEYELRPRGSCFAVILGLAREHQPEIAVGR
jgi:two-component system, LuxR family, sensor kinase FixL